MSRIKTYPITIDEFDDLMKSLNFTYNDVAELCGRISAKAVAWWRHKERIPVIHLTTLTKELQRQVKIRPMTEKDQKVVAFLKKAIALSDSKENDEVRENRIRREVAKVEWRTLRNDDLHFLLGQLDKERSRVKIVAELWKRHQQTKFKSDGSHFQVDLELNLELNHFFAKLDDQNDLDFS